jgi:hypothetical protein
LLLPWLCFQRLFQPDVVCGGRTTQALVSLKNLSRNDLVEVKSMTSPPEGVKMVMEAACIMFDEKPRITVDPTNIKRKVRHP